MLDPDRLLLLLVTDRRRSRVPLERAVAAAVQGGVTAVMLRERDLATDKLVELGRPLRQICRDAGVLFMVNGDLSAAQALDADGAHLGYGAPPLTEARRTLGKGAILGASTHDEEELERSLQDGADYVTYGPVFATPKSQHEREPRGVTGLRRAVLRAGVVPVVALGGVTVARAAQLRSAGAAGVAGIRCFLATSDPHSAAAQLRAAWQAPGQVSK